ncbi:MAG: hypothetical protein RR324_06195 [Cellulosilyticaceae bacterium]|uniref:hypothetical protein n=1 Tax=Niameybacter sp. TaxID=2033640 RepID=UPI002FCA834D
MDVINTISKAEGIHDKNANKDGLQFPGELTLNRPRIHEYLQKMYKKVIQTYKTQIALREGDFIPIIRHHKSFIGYCRGYDTHQCMILINLTKKS